MECPSDIAELQLLDHWLGLMALNHILRVPSAWLPMICSTDQSVFFLSFFKVIFFSWCLFDMVKIKHIYHLVLAKVWYYSFDHELHYCILPFHNHYRAGRVIHFYLLADYPTKEWKSLLWQQGDLPHPPLRRVPAVPVMLCAYRQTSNLIYQQW